MCGIAGILQPTPSSDMLTQLEAMSRSLAHRGPDDDGLVTWDGSGPIPPLSSSPPAGPAKLGLCHRRLAILDLTRAGRQPMTSHDGRYTIVFNGEIYNYIELRAELTKLGHIFHTDSDTEVLLACYVQWGREMFAHLLGMFAFAIVDTQRRTLLLGRDCFGIKPLYVTAVGGGLAFASEIKALLTLPQVRATANPQRTYDYLRFGLTDGHNDTMFAGISQVPPAHYIEVSLDSPALPEPTAYWHIDTSNRIDISFEEAARRMREMFLDSIRLHLRSDVPVGAALSGGIDSSAILTAMRTVAGDSAEIHAFTHVAEGELNEHAWAQMASREAGAHLHTTEPTAHELVEDLDELISIQDQPFASTSIYAQLRVFRLAKETGIKVMLDGQGADEMLAGYRPYIAARIV